MNYFITYGDHSYLNSRQRLIKEAENLRIFDHVIGYGKQDLSNNILNSTLMQFKRGGGYWVWKPYVIAETLKNMDEGDILVYADAGCSVFNSREWKRYFKYTEKYNMLAFLTNNRVEQYTRKNIIKSFPENGKYWIKKYQIPTGFIILKRTKEIIHLIELWQTFMLENTNCVVDVEHADLKGESSVFIENRHDQAIFTALCYKYKIKFKIKLLLNHFEGGKDKLRSQALIASRISDKDSRSQNRSFLKSILLWSTAEPIRYLRQKYWSIRNFF